MKKIILLTVLVLIAGAVAWYFWPSANSAPVGLVEQETKQEQKTKLVDFSQINPEFLFSAKIPENFQAEYVAQSRGINVYDPSLPGQTNLEKSVLFFTYFKANTFLTLSTVMITRQEPMQIAEKSAVLYEIERKDGTGSFSAQPNWRNEKHIAIDVRANENNPSYFYSFAYDPKFSEENFLKILNSVEFEKDF